MAFVVLHSTEPVKVEGGLGGKGGGEEGIKMTAL